MWQHPDMLMRHSDTLGFQALKLRTIRTPSNTYAEETTIYKIHPDVCKCLIRRNLLFLQVLLTCANRIAEETLCLSTMWTWGEGLGAEIFDKPFWSGHWRTNLGTGLDVLNFLEPFSTQILSTNLLKHKLQRHLFWALNRPIETLTCKGVPSQIILSSYNNSFQNCIE